MKKNPHVAIGVPAYKLFSNLIENERIAWYQFTKVYREYDFVLVCPQSLDTSGYLSPSLTAQARVERFMDAYFTGTDSYNKLLLAVDFYQRFEAYEYILICQSDVFVFYDALPEWCAKGYSYVGPLWFKGFAPPVEEAQLREVGNGGFSLRKVADALRVLHTRQTIFAYPTFVRECFSKGFVSGLSQLPTYVRRMLFANNTHHTRNDYPSQEDVFWSIICADRFTWYTRPTPTEALAFGFDYHPVLMLDLNGGKLPMAFHAWDRHRNEFWAQVFAEAGYVPAQILVNKG